MKILTRIFYDILLKINKSKSDAFNSNNEILKTYFLHNSSNIPKLNDNLSHYFNHFYNFCFELKMNNMLEGEINFKYNNKNGST